MASMHMHPDTFAKLKKDGTEGMKAQLARVGLSVGGNKPNLMDRYKNWWMAQSGATVPSLVSGPSLEVAGSSTSKPVTDSAGTAPAPAPEPVTVTSLDTSIDIYTIPLLERLLLPTNQKVSEVTLDCVKRLRYTPAAQFRKKAPRKDFSETLQPVQLFVDMFLKTLKQVNMTSEMGENETALRCFLAENLPEIQASNELTGFFNAWNIKVIPAMTSSHEPHGTEFDAQLAIALENSMSTAQSEAEQRQTRDVTQEDKDKEAEDQRKALLRELDVIACAIQHRLTRWATTFPQRTLADQLWPSTFSTEERKSIRDYVAEYIVNHELDSAEVSEEAQMVAVKDMQQDDDFPIDMARTASVIQAVFLETRFGNARRSRSQSQVTQTPSIASRNPSPVKGLPGLTGDEGMEDDVDDDDDEGGGNSVVNTRKRSRKSSSATNQNNHPEESDEDAYMDYQSRNPKRACRRMIKAREIAQNVDNSD